ncbi:MAG: Mur ligase domain-containing protein [Pseudohongiellaceae bacterium]
MAGARQLRLSSLLQGICSLPPLLDCDISGIALDSRRVEVGSLFLACKGSATDGRRFLADAIRRGAGAVLVEADAEWTQSTQQAAVPVIPVVDLPQIQSLRLVN